MANFARVIDGYAVDVSVSPETDFHPDIAAQFVSVPDPVRPGWVKVAGVWQAPAAPEPVAAVAARVSPVQFKLLFTAAERVAIKAARASNAVVDDYFSIVDDARLTHVDLGLSSTAAGLAYLVAKNLLTAERAAAILANEQP